MKTTAGSSGLNFWGLGVLLTLSRVLHLKTRRLRAKQKESGRDPLQDLRVLDKDKNKKKPPDCSVVSRHWARMRTMTRIRARLKPSVLFLLQSQLLRLNELFCKILLFGKNEIKNQCNVTLLQPWGQSDNEFWEHRLFFQPQLLRLNCPLRDSDIGRLCLRPPTHGLRSWADL